MGILLAADAGVGGSGMIMVVYVVLLIGFMYFNIGRASCRERVLAGV